MAIVAMTELGDFYYALHEGSTDHQVVTAFVTQLIERLAYHERKTIAFFGDNASWHTNLMIEPHLPHGVIWLKNAAASPQLNPIERLFGYLKKFFRKYNTRKRYLDLNATVMEAFGTLGATHVESSIRVMLRYVVRAYFSKSIFVDYRLVKEEEPALLGIN